MQIPGKQVAASDTAAEVKISMEHLMLTNDGSETIYMAIEQGQDGPQTPTADAALYFPLAAGEIIVLDSSVMFTAVHYVCDTGKTSYLRYLAWR